MMKKILVCIMLVFLPLYSGGILADDNEVIKKQNQLLTEIDNILNRKGLLITGRGMLLYDYRYAGGNAINTNGPVNDNTPIIQMDLNFEAHPYQYLSGGATLQMQNNLRGFYGTGDTISVKNYFAEAILLRFISLRFGYFNSSLTPLTLWAKNDESAYEAKIFKIRAEREDALYQLNLAEADKWPFEGAKIDFGFNFQGVDDELLPDRIKIESFAALIDKAEGNISYDRVFSAVRLSVFREGVSKLGVTEVWMGDIKKTGTSAMLVAPIGANIIASDIDIDLAKIFFAKSEKLSKLELYSEFGASSIKTNTTKPSSFDDYAFNSGLKLGIIKNIFEVKYIDVGNEFYSPGTQSWLFTTYLRQNPVFGGQGLEMNFFNREYNNKLQLSRGWFRPLKLSMPFGDETPNRNGYSLGLKSSQLDFIDLMVKYDSLNEIRPISTGDTKRSFKILELGGSLFLDKFLEEPFMPVVTFVYSSDALKREDDPKTIISPTTFDTMDESEDVTTKILTFGIEINMTGKLQILGGYCKIFQEGYYYVEDNNNNMPVIITGYDRFNVDIMTRIMSAGLIYQLNNINSIRLTYTWLSYENIKNKTKDYSLDHVQLFYLLNF